MSTLGRCPSAVRGSLLMQVLTTALDGRRWTWTAPSLSSRSANRCGQPWILSILLRIRRPSLGRSVSDAAVSLTAVGPRQAREGRRVGENLLRVRLNPAGRQSALGARTRLRRVSQRRPLDRHPNADLYRTRSSYSCCSCCFGSVPDAPARAKPSGQITSSRVRQRCIGVYLAIWENQYS